MISQEQFLETIEAFLERTGMSATAFGTGAINDPTLVFEIRKGRSCSLKVARRVADFMAKHPTEAA